MKFCVLWYGNWLVFAVFGSFSLYLNSSTQRSRFSWIRFRLSLSNLRSQRQAIHHSVMGEKGKKKVGEGGTGLLDDVGVPGGDGIFVNRVSAEYRAKYDGRERELLVRVVKQEMVHMEFVSSAITGSSGGVGT